jgi:hypothetical protein
MHALIFAIIVTCITETGIFLGWVHIEHGGCETPSCCWVLCVIESDSRLEMRIEATVVASENGYRHATTGNDMRSHTLNQI